MKHLKKTLAVVCALCMLMNLLISNAAGDLHLDTEEMVISNRRPILALTLGNGEGQVGYGGSEEVGYRGPSSFAVEDDVVYILDTLNKRIVVYENGQYSEISLADCPKASHMMYQNGKLAVVDNNSGVTAIYTTDGVLVKLISHPELVKEEVVAKVAEIGETYVVWETFSGKFRGYDWVEELSVSKDVSIQLKQEATDYAVYSTMSAEKQIDWTIDSENKVLNLLGANSGALVYQQYEYVPDVDMLFTEMSVRKVMADGSETYAIIDFSEWKAPASDPFYLSSDGNVYVMECLEEGTVISEVVFGTSDVSQMSELYQRAEERRLAVEEMEAVASTNSTITTPSHVATRTLVKERALQMINYTWTVKTSHKVKPSGYESQVTVPKCVQDAAVGSTFTGIPYCWGGYNGYDTLTGTTSWGTPFTYTRFADVVNAANKTAGNICSTVGDLTPGTIGVDCVGFVMSAYKFSREKVVSGMYTGYGESVSFTDMKPMDIIAKSGHVMLYAGESGGKLLTYEAYSGTDTSGNEIGGKTEIVDFRTLTSLATSGYVARNLFCTTCTPGDEMNITNTGHADICSECGWVMPEEQHENSSLVTTTPTTHTYRCSCGYLRPAEAHTFVNSRCSVCNIIQAVIFGSGAAESSTSVSSQEVRFENLCESESCVDNTVDAGDLMN